MNSFDYVFCRLSLGNNHRIILIINPSLYLLNRLSAGFTLGSFSFIGFLLFENGQI